MKTTVTWNGGQAYTGLANSGIPILMESYTSTDGKNCNGVRPMEMIAMGLAGCMAMDVLSILEKKRQAVTSFQVNLEAPRSSEFPKVFTSADITFVLAGRQIDERALLRSIELAATKYCSAYDMLVKAFPIALGYEIYEEAENGYRQLTCQGMWQATTPGE